jgi:hypothetical protein
MSGRIMVLCNIIFTVLDSRQEDDILNHMLAGVLQIYVLQMSCWIKFWFYVIIPQYFTFAFLSKDWLWWLLKFFHK